MRVFLTVLTIIFLIESPGFTQTLIIKHRHKEKTKSLSFNDSIRIPISNLVTIKKYNFKKRGIIEPFVYIGLLSAARIIVFPIAELIESGKDDALNALGVMTIATAVSGGVLLTALSKRAFNLTTDWEIILPITP